jgi:hypothetical protein
MKKIGEYTARGSVQGNGALNTALPTIKIDLFDGRFDTAYKVIEFKVLTMDSESYGILSTEDIGIEGTILVRAQDAGDNRQIAWGASPSNSYDGDEYVDTDNLIVQDLYVNLASTAVVSAKVSYAIKMIKYDITEWQGALAMVRNKSQDV